MGQPEIADDGEEADEEITGRVKILTPKQLNDELLDCGVFLKNFIWVDFYRISKKGPVHPSYVELFKAMTDKKMQILKQALANNTLSQQHMFVMFTSGVPSPNEFFKRRARLDKI